MKTETELKLEDIPPPPDGAVFSLVKIEKVAMPHPYCITPGHVSEASDHFGGMLSTEAIRSAEKKGIHCEICKQNHRQRGDRILSIEEHENPLTLFIRVPQNRDLNSVPGLHAYLLKLKELNLGIEGFAFPSK